MDRAYREYGWQSPESLFPPVNCAEVASRLLVGGYLGCGNIGDDAVLLGFLRGLEGQNVDVTVLSGAPEETFRNYGVRSINRKDFNEIKNALEKHDAFVYVGGSLFQDVTSVKSVAYYRKLVADAKKAGKKVIMLGQGIGPLKTFLGKRLASQAFSMADVIAVRDQTSAMTLKAMGYKGAVRQAADLAFLLPPPTGEDAGGFGVGSMKAVGLSPRPFGRGKEVVTLFSELSRLISQANLMPVLIEMDRKEDGQLIQEIDRAGKAPSIRKIGTPMQLQQRLARMEGMIAMRLHAGILAATVGVPPFMISYDPKVTAFAQTMELPPALPVAGLSASRVFEGYMNFAKDRERYQGLLIRKINEQKALAEINIQILLDTLAMVRA